MATGRLLDMVIRVDANEGLKDTSAFESVFKDKHKTGGDDSSE